MVNVNLFLCTPRSQRLCGFVTPLILNLVTTWKWGNTFRSGRCSSSVEALFSRSIGCYPIPLCFRYTNYLVFGRFTTHAWCQQRSADCFRAKLVPLVFVFISFWFFFSNMAKYSRGYTFRDLPFHYRSKYVPMGDVLVRHNRYLLITV